MQKIVLFCILTGLLSIVNAAPCPLYSTYSTKTKQCECWQGYAKKENKCIKIPYCRLNSYYDIIKGECIQCPAYSLYDRYLNECLCVGNLEKVEGKCVDRCLTNEVRVAGKCECKSGYYKINGTCVACPLNSYYQLQQDKCICIQGFTPNISGQCVNGTEIKNTPTVGKCPQNSYYSYRSFQCKTCPQQSLWDKKTGLCICFEGYEELNEKCLMRCLVNEARNIFTEKCECIAGTFRIQGVCGNCPKYSNYDKNKQICVCTQSLTMNTDGQCIKVCPANEIWDLDAFQCVCKRNFDRDATGICIARVLQVPPANPFIPGEALQPYMFTTEITGEIPFFVPQKKVRKTSPSDRTQEVDELTIYMRSIQQQILPNGFPKTTVYAYGGMTNQGQVFSSPSPSIIAEQNITTKVKYVNELTGQLFLPQDSSHHFNNPTCLTQICTVPHAHGIVTTPRSDGHPRAYWTAQGDRGQDFSTLDPNGAKNEAVFSYTNEQDAGLFWYHDHSIGITRLTVYAGLAGLYTIKTREGDISSQQQNLAKFYGNGIQVKNLAISDKSFYPNGSLYYPTQSGLVQFQTWVPEFFGNTILVNGRVWPKMVLEPKKYRFTILNACNSRYLNLYAVAQTSNLRRRIPFDLIRTGGDYLNNPIRVMEYLMSPALRVEIVLDLEGFDVGASIIFMNDAPGPYPFGQPVDAFVNQVFKIQIKGSSNARQIQTLPLKSSVSVINQCRIENEAYPAFAAGLKKVFVINQAFNAQGQLVSSLINNVGFKVSSDECQNDPFIVGQTYDIYFVNLTPDTHPFHFHLINFQKIKAIPFNATAFQAEYVRLNGPFALGGYPSQPVSLDPQAFLTGPEVLQLPFEESFRDTIDMHTGFVTVIRMKFAHNDGRDFSFDVDGANYVFHCHILEHQDNDMMRNYCLKRL